ncbi:MAG: hypothetical protein WKF43_12800 [Acidimicrobiales bacterium]
MALAPGAQFCTQCGSVVAAEPERTVPIAPTQTWTPPAPATPTPTPPPSWLDQTMVSAPIAPPTRPDQPFGPPPQWQPQAPDGSQWAVPTQFAPLPPAPAPDTGGNLLGAALAFLGAVLLVVGAFTPWVRTRLDTFTGWTASPDGKTVVGLAVVAIIAAVVLVAGARAVALRLILVAIAVAALVIALINILTVSSRVDDGLNPAVGIGLILVPMGAVLLLASAALTRSSRA